MLEMRQTNGSDKEILLKKKTKLENAMRELEDARFVHKTIEEENFLSIFNRYNEEIKGIDQKLISLQDDHSDKIKTLEVVLRLAENIGLAYSEANTMLKRNYLNLFFKKFTVRKGKVIKYYLTDGIKDLIENGSVRVTENGLPLHLLTRIINN